MAHFMFYQSTGIGKNHTGDRLRIGVRPNSDEDGGGRNLWGKVSAVRILCDVRGWGDQT